jgi:hypothetical protein
MPEEHDDQRQSLSSRICFSVRAISRHSDYTCLFGPVSSDMVIFGKRAVVKVVVDDDGLEVEGFVDEFTLGPLTVTGNDGPRASLGATLKRQKQEGHIDGVIMVFGARTELKANFELRPNFKFGFHFALRLGDMFELAVDAGLARASTITATSCDISNEGYILEAKFHQEILAHIRKKISDALVALEKDVREAATKALRYIEEQKAQFNSGVEALRSDVRAWREQGRVDDWRRQQILSKLAWAIEEKIKLYPEDIQPSMVDQFRILVREHERAKADFEDLKHRLDKALKDLQDAQEEQLKQVPAWMRGLHRAVLETSGTAIWGLASVNGLRDQYKPREIAYLRAQVELTAFMLKLMPERLASDLEPMLRDLVSKFERERTNSFLEDLLEEVGDSLLGIIGAIVDVALQIAGSLGSLLFDAAHGVVKVVSDAAQEAIRLMNSCLSRLLSLIDITDVYLKGELGTSSHAFSFLARVQGTVDGKPFRFELRLEITDFADFLLALIKR